MLAQKEKDKWHCTVQHHVSDLFITLIRDCLVQNNTLKRQVSFLNPT